MVKTTAEQFVTIVAVLKTAFPKDNFLQSNEAISLWYELLKDIDYEHLLAGTKKYLLTGRYVPTIADIRSCSIPEDDTSEGDAWSLVQRAITRSTYYAAEEYEKLPADIQKAVGTPDVLKSWAMDENYNAGVVQSQFLRSYRLVKERNRELDMLSPDVKQILGVTAALLGKEDNGTEV